MIVATGLGAAIVIVGAMFKIMHWPGASVMLVAGLSTEAFLFLLGVMEEPAHEIDWTLVYPELAYNPHEEGDEEHDALDDEDSAVMKEVDKKGGNDPIAQKLDMMLQDANIGADLISSLGVGMRNLSESASNMNNLADAAPATQEFVSSINNAKSNVETLSDNYLKANQALEGLVSSNPEGASYAEELQKLSKNLSELNGVYEMQLNSSGESIKLNAQVNENINALLTNLSDSVEDTKRYKDQVSQLGQNLEALNTVYGNMLSAMNFNK